MPPTDQRARFPYLFIITYGRSGSTLLQGILNSIPGYCIRGENQGALNLLWTVYRNARTSKKRFVGISKSPSDAWYGISDLNLDILVQHIRNIMLDVYMRPDENTACIGFKEIRYAPKMVADLTDYLRFMSGVFPGAGFIFNSRNIEDTAKSDFWANHENPVEFLTDFRQSMLDAFEFFKDRENFFWLEYDDYRDNPENLEALFDFLHEPFDLQKITSVMKVPHSANNRTLQR